MTFTIKSQKVTDGSDTYTVSIYQDKYSVTYKVGVSRHYRDNSGLAVTVEEHYYGNIKNAKASFNKLIKKYGGI
jgi:hypothetical protein